jgi:mono/diheme cytochrome c family protein
LNPTGHCLALAAIFIAPTAFAADADNGERLAQRWCASCHVVASNQRAANADAPPFEVIARMFGFDAKKLVFFLLEPHPKMPSMALTRREADDIAAYIGTLAK